MTMPNIVRDVLKAYKKTKLKPKRGLWCTNKSACALGALLCAKTGSKKSQKLEAEAVNLLGDDYVSGFVSGFDEEYDDIHSLKEVKSSMCYSGNMAKGYWHGLLTAKKVFNK